MFRHGSYVRKMWYYSQIIVIGLNLYHHFKVFQSIDINFWRVIEHVGILLRLNRRLMGLGNNSEPTDEKSTQT